MGEYEIIDGGQEQYTETTEIVEEVVEPVIDYTPVIYEGINSIITIILFSAFAILGFFSAIQIFGRTKS